MREKIAENLYKLSASARYGADFPNWETIKSDQQDFFRKKADTLVLFPITEEIEKVENPDYCNPYIEDFRQTILSLFKEEK